MIETDLARGIRLARGGNEVPDKPLLFSNEPQYETCPYCWGSGIVYLSTEDSEDDIWENCSDCDGTGEIEVFEE